LYSVTPGSSLWFWICPRANDPQRDRLEQRGRRKIRNIASWQWLKDFQGTGNSDVPSSLTWPRSHFFDGIEPPVANAGDLHISLRDRVDQNIVSMTVGSFGYDRFLSLGSTKLGDGWLLYAGEFNTYDGPWVTAEDVRKFSGLLRYSQGTPTNGFSATAMAYTSNWNSPAGFPQAQIGNAPGNFIPEAPWMVASAGITFGEKTGWFSALGWRYISSRPLTEDGVFQSPPLNTINANVGYRFANGWRVQLDALNLLNSTS
jgi:TonB dependent receptor